MLLNLLTVCMRVSVYEINAGARVLANDGVIYTIHLM